VQGVETLWLQQLANDDLQNTALPNTLHAMVAFARVATCDPHALGEEHYAALQDAGLTDDEVYELIATIDLFQNVNSYTDLARVPIDQLA
jgi:alkylhydroperoxidase family enzyme